MIAESPILVWIHNFDITLAHDLGGAMKNPNARAGAAFLAGPFGPALFAPFLLFTMVRGGARGIKIALATLALGAATSTLTTLLIKPLVARPMPVGEGFGFPDAPAATAFAIGFFLALYYMASGSWNILLALVIAMATIAAGVAFPSDAIVGSLLGFVLALIAWNATRNNIGAHQFRDRMTSELSARQASKMSRR